MKIDKVFSINLPERPDRKGHIVNEMNKHGFEYRLWRATKRENGFQGLLKSMEGLLEHCRGMEYNNILVFEDDAKLLVDNPKEVIEKCISQLPVVFDMCYFGVNLWQEEVKLYSPNLIKLTDGYATHSILYSRSGIVKLLNAIMESDYMTPLDVLIKEKIMPDGKCFASFPIICSQISGQSDITGKHETYTKFLENRFEERTKHLVNE